MYHLLIDVDYVKNELDFRVSQLNVQQVCLYRIANLHLSDGDGQVSLGSLVREIRLLEKVVHSDRSLQVAVNGELVAVAGKIV